MSQSFLIAAATRTADVSQNAAIDATLVDRVLGDCDLLDIIFGFLPQKTSLRDRTMAASTCKEFTSYRPNLKRVRLIELAKLAQSKQRYFSMRQCTLQIVRMIADDEQAPDLSRQERLLLSESYKHSGWAYRKQLDELQLFEENQRAKPEESSLLGLIASHRRHLFGKLRALAEELLHLINATLLPRARARVLSRCGPLSRAYCFARELEPRQQAGCYDDEAYYLKLRGDGLRWLAEQSHQATADAYGTAQRPWYGQYGPTRVPRSTLPRSGAAATYPRDAEIAYLEALRLAKRHLPWDSTRLGCVNNFAVLLWGTLDRRVEACALVRDALEQLKRAHPLEGAAWLDRVAPLQDLLRDNLRMWEEEEERERGKEVARRRAVDDEIVEYPRFRGQGTNLTLRAWRKYSRLGAADVLMSMANDQE